MSPPDAVSVVVLSPHFDDAVISVGGLLARQVAEGREAVVATVYAAAPPRTEGLPARYRGLLAYELRREQDQNALASLGVQALWLSFCERAVLTPALPRPLAIFRLPRPAVLEQFRNLPALKAVVVNLLAARPQPLILAPLAIGGHIDHAEVFLAAVLVMLETDSYDRFRFYEDTYVMSASARRRHFIRELGRWRRRDSPALAGPVQAGMLWSMGHAARGPRLEEYCPQLVSVLDWIPEPVPLGAFEPAKLEAMKLYALQMARLGGYSRFAAMIRRWHTASGKAEWLWRAQRRNCANDSATPQEAAMTRS